MKPMVASLYVTVKCNFRCTYCDDGSGTIYPELPEPGRMDTEQTLRVIELMREASPGFNITGGEPTLRPDIDLLYDRVGELGFMPVTFNTNAFLLDRHLRILRNIDYLVVSLDAIDQARGDALIDTGKGGQSRRVLDNLALAADFKREQRLAFETIINTVILPETIEDAWDVWELCLARGWFWSPMPHIVGKYPNPGLVDNPAWLELVDEVIRAKKKGALIYGGLPALRAIRDFSRYECYPTTRPVIYPNGDLMYPCAPLQTVAANLLEAGSYEKALQVFRRRAPSIRRPARRRPGCAARSQPARRAPFAAPSRAAAAAQRGKAGARLHLAPLAQAPARRAPRPRQPGDGLRQDPPREDPRVTAGAIRGAPSRGQAGRERERPLSRGIDKPCAGWPRAGWLTHLGAWVSIDGS